ncbi:hypothetical protein JW935_26660 [candidate division KSB1 bacterium]|nr:hypothetical protein [candidate division KSB1 bacterium]
MLNTTDITVKCLKATRVLAVFAAMLFILSITGQYMQYIAGHAKLLGFIAEFNLDRENNIPTYFSSLLLFFVAMLCFCNAKMAPLIHRRYWQGLCYIFIFLSIDEMASLHERLAPPVRNLLGTTGIFYYAWIIPGVAVTVLFVIIFFKFWKNQDRQTKKLFLFSIVIYIGGAIFLEMAGGWICYHTGRENLTYGVVASIEELLEMAGTILFIYTLLRKIKTTSMLRLRLE